MSERPEDLPHGDLVDAFAELAAHDPDEQRRPQPVPELDEAVARRRLEADARAHVAEVTATSTVEASGSKIAAGSVEIIAHDDT